MSYVDGPELLLHVVGGEEVGDAGELEEKVVLETKDGGRSDEGGLREDFPSNLLTASLLSC